MTDAEVVQVSGTRPSKAPTAHRERQTAHRSVRRCVERHADPLSGRLQGCALHAPEVQHLRGSISFFSQAGVVYYQCSIHPVQMRGGVIVG